MKLKQKNHSIDSLFSFLLLLIFCLFALLLAGMGSSIYKNGAEHLNENYTSRTAIAYLTEKVRQHDRAGDIFLTDVEGCEAVALRDVLENEDAGSDRDAAERGGADVYADATEDEGAGNDRSASSGERFITYVYFHDGALCELFVREDVTPLANMGSRIVELKSFEVEEVTAADADGTPESSLNMADGTETADVDDADADGAPEDSPDMLAVTAVSQEGNTLSALIPLRSK